VYPYVLLSHMEGQMHVTSVNVDSTDACGREKRLVTVCVKLSGPRETMTINVVVPQERDDQAAQEYAIARAKDFARQFANMPLHSTVGLKPAA
jgi:hypothetical protein